MYKWEYPSWDDYSWKVFKQNQYGGYELIDRYDSKDLAVAYVEYMNKEYQGTY